MLIQASPQVELAHDRPQPLSLDSAMTPLRAASELPPHAPAFTTFFDVRTFPNAGSSRRAHFPIEVGVPPAPSPALVANERVKTTHDAFCVFVRGLGRSLGRLDLLVRTLTG